MRGPISSHTEVNYQTHNTGKAAHSDCWFCGVEEKATTHILWDCVALENEPRDSLLRGALL